MKNFAQFPGPFKGVASDVPPFSVARDVFTGARNIVFRPHAERAPGRTAVYATPQAPIRSLLNAELAGVNYWLYHGTSTSYAVNGATHTNVTHASGLTTVTAANAWSVGLFNGLPFANNGVDPPMYWDGNIANDFVTLPGWVAGDVAYTMRAWGNFLLALNLSTSGGDYPDQIKWSSAAAAGSMPSSWTAAATNEAGAKQASDTPGGLIDGAPLGSAFALYKRRDAHLLEYLQGSNEVFSLRRLPIGRGVLARNCIADVRGRHFLVTADGDIVLTDGITVESVAKDRMARYVFGQLEQAAVDHVFVAPFPTRSEVYVCFPSAGQTFCDQAAVWNYQSNQWGAVELPSVSCAALGIVSDTSPDETWDADAGAWDSDATLWNAAGYSTAVQELLFGKPNDAAPTSSLILAHERGLDENGTAFTAQVSKYGMDFGDRRRVKITQRVYLHVEADVGTELTVRLGSQMDVAAAVTWGTPVTFTVGTDESVPCMVAGRLISLEVYSSASAAWKLPAFDIEFAWRGFH